MGTASSSQAKTVSSIPFGKPFYNSISRVPDQNGASQA